MFFGFFSTTVEKKMSEWGVLPTTGVYERDASGGDGSVRSWNGFQPLPNKAIGRMMVKEFTLL
jgi:hypothetical protein